MEANYQDIFLSGYINRLRGHLVVKNETHWHYYIPNHYITFRQKDEERKKLFPLAC